MANLGVYNSVALITSGAGIVSIAPSASIEVRKESDGLLASIFKDEPGLTALSNPFFANADGEFEFYAAGIDLGYQVKVTKGGEVKTYNNQPVGTLQYRDIVDADKLADQVVVFHYSGVAIDEEVVVDGFLFDEAVTITGVTIYAREAPTGANLTLDFLKDQVEQTKIATLTAAAKDEKTTIAGLSYTTAQEMGLKIKSVGSTFEGAELIIIVHYHVTALT